VPEASVELLRAATFTASQHGLGGKLVDPNQWSARPAPAVLQCLITHVQDALEESGDLALASDGIERLLRTGNGASQQRQAFARGGEAAVIDLLAQL
jgi:carboxylate-amine ligase